MHRLTKRMKGVKGFALLSDELDGKYTPYQVIDLLANKLADYEDLGYDPVEIRALAASFNAMKAEAAPLIRAKIAETLVILPCRIGETVYVIDWCGGFVDGMRCCYDCNGVQRERVFKKDCIPYCEIDEVPFQLNMLERIGKDVFLTREEAEQKMEEKANGNSVNR